MEKLKNKSLNNPKESFFSGLKLYKDVFKAGAMVSLSNAKHLKMVLKKVGTVIAVLTLESAKDFNKFTLVHNFGVYILRMYNIHGEEYTIRYLKASQLAVQKYIAGTPFTSMRQIEPDFNLPRLSTRGLPDVIGLRDRAAIGNGSRRVIRFWLSLFSIYRILKMDCKAKLNTITDEYSGDIITLIDFNNWLHLNVTSKIANFTDNFSLEVLSPKQIIPIQKSSSLGDSSFHSILASINALALQPSVWNSCLDYLKLCGSNYMLMILRDGINLIQKIKSVESTICNENFDNFVDRSKHPGIIGRLSFKEEAAGKLRVFAMVDVVTQSILHPLHQYLFDILKKIPNDGTFDQEGIFEYAKSLAKKYNQSFGFDLSAATDRLPLANQIEILNNLFNSNIGNLWGSILTKRYYHIPKNHYGIESKDIKYEVGQPMGALSSWAMLAVTHHMMVQYCASMVGLTKYGHWYKDYVILGDDLVIFDKSVADKYLELCQGLGVSINLNKSVIATKPVLEFAKRTALGPFDVSALSFKDVLTNNTFFGRLALTTRLIRRGYGTDFYKLFILGNKINVRSAYDIRLPIVGYLLSAIENKEKMGQRFEVSDLLSLITSKDHKFAYFGRSIGWLDPKILIRVLRGVLSGTFSRNMLNKDDLEWSIARSDSFKLVLIDRILNSYRKLIKFNWNKNFDSLIDRGSHLQAVTTKFYVDLDRNKYKSLELSKELHLRSYYHDWVDYMQKLGILGDWRFFCLNLYSSDIREEFMKTQVSYQEENWSSWGDDEDEDILWPAWHEKLKDLDPYLGKYSELVQTRLFADLDINTLISWEKEITSLLTTLTFYKVKASDLSKDKVKVENPLRILDFIQDSQDPRKAHLFNYRSTFVNVDTEQHWYDDIEGWMEDFKYDVSQMVDPEMRKLFGWDYDNPSHPLYKGPKGK